MRINEILKSAHKVDVEEIKKMQLDNTSSLATEALPVLMNKLNKRRLNKQQLQLATKFEAGWHGSFARNDEYALFYSYWLDYIKRYTWDEFRKSSGNTQLPFDYTLLDMIEKDPENIFFDKQGTSVKENAEVIVTAAFLSASHKYQKDQIAGSTTWGDHNKLSIMHLTNIPAFSDTSIKSAGYPEVINASKANWGPTWRMVVELGSKPNGYGIYAGGQSGNIGSIYYDNFIKDWADGKYYPLLFFMKTADATKYRSAAWTIIKK